MSSTVYIFPDKPHAELDTGSRQAYIHASPYPAAATVVLRTYAEADMFVRAAEEARRLLATLPGDGAS